MECGAKLRNKDAKCKAPAMPNGKCRIHGGTSLAGIAAPSFKSGSYSKYAVARIASTIEERQNRPARLSLVDSLDLLDARLVDILGRVDSGESGETWKALQSAVHEFDKAERRASGSSSVKVVAEAVADREEAMRTIIVLVQAGMADWAAWREVGSVIEQIRKTTETEVKNQIAAREMITREQLGVNEARYMQAVLDVVVDFVPPELQRKAKQELSAKCMAIFLE